MKAAALVVLDASVVMGLSLFLVGSALQRLQPALQQDLAPFTTTTFHVTAAVLVVIGLLTRRRPSPRL